MSDVSETVTYVGNIFHKKIMHDHSLDRKRMSLANVLLNAPSRLPGAFFLSAGRMFINNLANICWTLLVTIYVTKLSLAIETFFVLFYVQRDFLLPSLLGLIKSWMYSYESLTIQCSCVMSLKRLWLRKWYWKRCTKSENRKSMGLSIKRRKLFPLVSLWLHHKFSMELESVQMAFCDKNFSIEYELMWSSFVPFSKRRRELAVQSERTRETTTLCCAICPKPTEILNYFHCLNLHP